MTSPDGDPVCVDADADDDNDGLPASKDFCQHMAGGAFDEDGDGIGDECDACPIARPPAEPETDNDGVDAPCDPDPRLGGAKIVFFDGFNGTALSDKWKASGTAWTVKDGTATIAATGLEEITVGMTPSNKLEMFTDYRIAQADSQSADIGVEAVNVLPMGVTQVICGGHRMGVDFIHLSTQTINNDTAADANLFDTTARYGVLGQIDGGNANCVYNSTRFQSAIGAATNGEAMNRAGLMVKGASASFNFFLIVQH